MSGYTFHGATCQSLSLVLGAWFPHWWCSSALVSMSVLKWVMSLLLDTVPVSWRDTLCGLGCKCFEWRKQLLSIPFMSTGWAGYVGTYLWQLSDVLMENPRELTQGKPQEFVGHLVSPCICHADTVAYVRTALPSASCRKSRVRCHHIHHRSLPACAEFSFTVKVSEAPTQK